MRLAHISDLHLVARDPGGTSSPLSVATAIAGDLIAIAETLDLVVVSGDLTDRAEPDAFRAFEEVFSDIGLPIVTVPGNHDGPAEMHAFSDASDTFFKWHITNRVVSIGGLRLLGLDTCVQKTTQGALDDTALDLVEAEVGKDDAPPLVIVMHHPPLFLGQRKFDSFCELDGRARLMRHLMASRVPVTVLSGHVHRPYTAEEGPVRVFVAGSMFNPQDSPLPFGDTPLRPAPRQDFYYIHDITPGGAHVVTPQRVRGLLG